MGSPLAESTTMWPWLSRIHFVPTRLPYGNLVGTKWMRDNQGHIVVDSASGLPIRDSRQVVLGNYNPDWVGGITNTLTYKNLSLSFSFDGQLGGKVYSVTKWFGQYSGILQATLQGREHEWNDSLVVPNAVYQDGTPNKIGRASCRERGEMTEEGGGMRQ